MLKFNWMLLTACLIFLMAISGMVQGKQATPGESKPIAGAVPQGGLLLASQPWPDNRCYADQRGRSSFKGPGANLVETKSINLYSELQISDPPPLTVFRVLRAGKGNQIYFIYLGKDQDATLCAYNLNSGLQWNQPVSRYTNVCLDEKGKVYYILKNGYELDRVNPDGTGDWVRMFPIPGDDPLREDYLMVGKRVYVVATPPNDGKIYSISKTDPNDQWIYTYGPSTIHRMAEDAQGNLYVRFADRNKGIIKIGPDGVLKWRTPLVLPGVTPSPQLFGEFTPNDLGPICGQAGYIWGNERVSQFDDQGYTGVPFYVLAPDGSIYKSGGYGIDEDPLAACYGSDGRLYIATKGGVNCYQDGDDLQWSTNFPGPDTLRCMVMDADNVIYGASSDKLYVLEGSSGNILATLPITVTGELGTFSSLAIGDGGKLIWLNSRGRLKVFGTKLVKIPGAMKAMPLVKNK
jgi:hypothetical protein